MEDIDREEAKLGARGVTVPYRSRFQNGGGAAYFDTRKIGGVHVEFIRWLPK